MRKIGGRRGFARHQRESSRINMFLGHRKLRLVGLKYPLPPLITTSQQTEP
jgi:hypothetical protein